MNAKANRGNPPGRNAVENRASVVKKSKQLDFPSLKREEIVL
jgi:hypothetical protein